MNISKLISVLLLTQMKILYLNFQIQILIKLSIIKKLIFLIFYKINHQRIFKNKTIFQYINKMKKTIY